MEKNKKGKYSKAIMDRCLYYGIICFDIYNYSTLDFQKDYYTRYTTDDGLHPNSIGHDKIFKKIIKEMGD